MATLGSFSEDPQLTWLTAPHDPTDRRMQLLREFWYKDPAGTVWKAPKDSIVDGASIPAALWSTIGSPYTGHYRRASIVHDVACDQAQQAADPGAARAAADKMFYQACLAGGCPAVQAELLYAGVRIGAWLPHIQFWRQPMHEALLATNRTQPDVPEESVRTTYREIAAAIQAAAPRTFAQLEAVVNHHLQAKAAQPLPAAFKVQRQLAPRPRLAPQAAKGTKPKPGSE